MAVSPAARRRPSVNSASSARRRDSSGAATPPPRSGSRVNTAAAARYRAAAIRNPAAVEWPTNSDPPTAPTKLALIPASADTALPVTSASRGTVRGSAAPLAASTNRDDDSSNRTPRNAAGLDSVTTVPIAATASSARSSDTTISVRRRSHRSINTPANGPTRLNRSSVTASTAAIRAGVAPCSTSNSTNCAKVIWARPSANWPRHCPPTSGRSGPASSARASRQPRPPETGPAPAGGAVTSYRVVSGVGGGGDLGDRLVQRRVELLVALLRGQALGERAREAGDHAVVARQPGARLLPGVTAGQRDHPQHLGMLDELLVEVVGVGQGQLQHHHLAVRQRVDRVQQRVLQLLLGLGLLRAVDVDLGFDDRHQALGQDLLG